MGMKGGNDGILQRLQRFDDRGNLVEGEYVYKSTGKRGRLLRENFFEK
jgi:hypothetical protein